jgi:hypothetical protein
MSQGLADHPDRMPGLMIAAGVLFALIFTLIFLAIEQAVTALKARRVKPVVHELLDDRLPSRRILGNSRPRIGK